MGNQTRLLDDLQNGAWTSTLQKNRHYIKYRTWSYKKKKSYKQKKKRISNLEKRLLPCRSAWSIIGETNCHYYQTRVTEGDSRWGTRGARAKSSCETSLAWALAQREKRLVCKFLSDFRVSAWLLSDTTFTDASSSRWIPRNPFPRRIANEIISSSRRGGPFYLVYGGSSQGMRFHASGNRIPRYWRIRERRGDIPRAIFYEMRFLAGQLFDVDRSVGQSSFRHGAPPCCVDRFS